MESKKFVNLSAGYKTFLLNCEQLNLNEIDGSTSFDILKDYVIQVEDNARQNGLEILDINHIMLNYDKSDKRVECLKKLIHYKNYYLISNCLRSNKWKQFIKTIKIQITNAKTLEIENAVLELFNKYLGMWNVLDNIILMDKKNNIKGIELVDPEDYDFVFNLLKK